MSTSILPDDSVVVRLPDRTVHVDASEHWVRVRATHARQPLGGAVLAVYDFSQIRRLRIVPRAQGGVGLTLMLRHGEDLPLGVSPSSDVAMLTGRAVADICRCQLDAGHGVSVLAESSSQGSDPDTFKEVLQSSGAVVPLDGPQAPASAPAPVEDPDRITDEQPVPRTAPARAASLYRVTRELTREEVDRELATADPAPAPVSAEPAAAGVFGELLRQSQLASALDPNALQASLEPAPAAAPNGDLPEDQKPTRVGITALGGRPEAVAELLNLAAEHLPLALVELPDAAEVRARSRIRRPQAELP